MSRPSLAEPEDGASFAFVRAAFGAVIAYHALHYLATGRIERLYLEPPLHFRYLFFEWVAPLPGIGVHLAHVAMGLAGIALALGLRARLAAAIVCVVWAYAFLLEQARYLNHAYLIGLLAFVFALVPTRAGGVPRWGLRLLQLQLAIPYVYGGLAKLEPDWLAARPAELWLAERGELFLVGWMHDAWWGPYLLAWGGLAFDLLVVPLLYWRRTRAAAFSFVLFFHLANAQIFDIGVFPWLMIPATTIFFAPSWPRRWAPRAFAPFRPELATAPPGALLRWVVALHVALQLVLPFRHLLYPGRTAWTEQAHSFAWRMMLRSKIGEALFRVYDPARGAVELVDPAAVLPEWQARKMACRPDLLHQFALWLAAQRGPGTQVRVDSLCSLNGRPAQPLVDPSTDLAAEPRRLVPAPWILPLATCP
jgi:vitamin K-dependent gamma-carboxylase